MRKVHRIIKLVSTFNDVSVKHIVYMLEKKKDVFEDLRSSYPQQGVYKDPRYNIINLYTKSREGISIESTSHKLNDSPISTYFTYNNLYEVKEFLNECSKWFTDNNMGDIFKYTQNGKPFGITDKYSDYFNVIYFKGQRNRYLIGVPAVIYDGEDSYTGIRLKNESGIIGDMTNSEFMNFKMCLEDLIHNLYSNSLILTSGIGDINERDR